ncbi:MAG TPA: bifunctional heptose 7-phosphate kinase/heptose 1-phosphate adenyltransferase [Bauldia sp.]|nr:bifunctional heptose 7-phosphate kinase/heptose 1-phosphate adenyltransferase [Bauldia sp.]
MDASLIDRLAQANVLVLGDVILDRFVEGKVTRVSREAPVPVLKFRTSRAHMGGACNVAANLLAYGASVILVGICGTDDAADELAALAAGFRRLDARLLPDSGRQTTVKTRYVSGWQQLLCVDAEDTHPLPEPLRRQLVETSRQAIAPSKALVLSDYGRGTLAADTIKTLITDAQHARIPIVVDPRHADPAVFAGASVVTPNTAEMEAFTGIAVDTAEAAVRACNLVLDRADIGAVLLTRGAGGMTLCERGKPPLHIAAETRRVYDVSGAGDTVVATIAAAIAAGALLADAVRLANTAAGIAVAKPGTATVDPEELRRAMGLSPASDIALGRAEAAERVAEWRRSGLRVGFTNGCFDLLHRGHLHSLAQASRRVDRLIVGINSDASTRRLKGEGRPVQDAATRAALLSATRFVDGVVVFEEDTPEALIRAIVPDVIFKGEDYLGQDVPGAAFIRERGGAVEFLPLLSGYSTTATVERLQKKVTRDA